MSKKSRRILTWILFVLGGLLVIICLYKTKPISYESFKKSVNVTEKEATIGTNITLHQKIHGTNGVRYRYKLETDCPYWKYEDRYVSETPLSFLDNSEVSAVETEAKSITMNLDGNTLVSGQYFSVPILSLRMDDISYEAYKESLYEQAYQLYVLNLKNTRTIGCGVIIGVVISLWFLIPIWRKDLMFNENEN